MSRVHVLPVKVYYEDTDFTGSVYYANYLKFFERGRSELLSTERLREEYAALGVGLVVYRAEVTYRKPARYGDALEVHTSTSTIGDYRLVFHQSIHRADEKHPLVRGTIEAAQVDRDGSLMPLLDWIKEKANEE